MPDPFVLKGIKETCLYTDDLAALRRFYEGGLGLPCFSYAPGENAFFRAGTSVLLCFDRRSVRDQTALPQHWGEGELHFAFEASQGANYAAWLEKVRSSGIAIEHEHIWPGGYRSFYFRDPDRNCVEILEEGMWEHHIAVGKEAEISDADRDFLRQAIQLAAEGMARGDGGPFGCVITSNGKVIASGNNKVTSANDPTAHAEVVAIRAACTSLESFQLEGCTVYASCEPCPMCLGALYWARPDRIVFAATRADAADAGFDDQLIYDELPLQPASRRLPTVQALRDEGCKVLKSWQEKADKKPY